MKKLKNPTFVIILTVIILAVVAFKPALGSVAKPAVPEFTVTYNMPATVELSIRNQNVPTAPIDTSNYTLYYNVRAKGHFEDVWIELYNSYSENLPAQSNSQFTILSLSVASLPIVGQVDFQVQAILGDHYVYYTPQHPLFPGPWGGYGVIGVSEWSSPQTLTIGADSSTASPDANNPNTSRAPNSSTTSPKPSPPPSSTDQTTEPTTNEAGQIIPLTIIGVGVALVLVGIGLLAYSKKRKAMEEIG
jgi:hypothetical protein